MTTALIGLAGQVGLPILRKILEDKLGGAGGSLAADVIEAVAGRVGVAPDDLDAVINSQPGVVIDAMREVERMAPEMVALYASGLEYQMAVLQAEKGEPLWARAWRPGWMYLLGLFWAWNIVVLHIANAIWKIALPAAPWDILMSLTGIFMALYMGGHTLKDVAAKWGQAK
ncbi:hypothetical protein EGN72_02530 [Pseudorhodobacter sp. E13]|uniref:hypothetical protein n=1 Tax=Pseudorhodobacter sp. E13 TaxID=2487931 RepID=UPI000F8E0799|nr:hypothetical protein [Pseudorhodobacter sp. E13]RUS64887.1 hypothetical protein EGN72_02530 [Pseudorhodobacter sp. E13]